MVWDLAINRPPLRFDSETGDILSLAFSPGGTLLASIGAYERCIRIWDPRSGRLERVLVGHPLSTNAVTFSPDGGLLATTGGDGVVKLWSVAAGRVLHRLDGQTPWLNLVAFSPDGKLLAATGGGGDVRLWDLAELGGTTPGP
jgi:WD40 repeat protein